VRGKTALRLPVTVSVKKSESKPARSENEAAALKADDFEIAFNGHWSRVYGVVYRIIGDPAEAEDLALETFLRLHQRPPRHEANLGGWLYRVATNLAFNALRGRKRRTGYENQSGEAILDRQGALNPGEAVERAERRRRVRAVLAGMKGRPAKLLILRHSGFSYTEIAAALGLAPSSVGTLLSRAEREFERRYREKWRIED
jgi:RNA polymerase sigma-70 factor (ECF subfamily)